MSGSTTTMVWTKFEEPQQYTLLRDGLYRNKSVLNNFGEKVLNQEIQVFV